MKIKNIVPKRVWLKLRLFKAAVERTAFRILWVFPVDQKKIVFSNFNGKGYGDNPKYIAEAFLRHGEYNLFWLSRTDAQKFPEGINPVKHGSIIALYHIATAKVWIDNNRKEPYIAKRKGQFYLQTWHGSIALKKIEKDAEDTVDEFYKTNARRDSKMIDLMISDSIFSDRLYGESFWYDGEVRRLGTPRFDPLFNKNDCLMIKSELRIDPNQYVVLYAPTFRNNTDSSVYDINLKAVKEAFEVKMGKNVAVLARMHPHIPIGHIQFDKSIVKDVTQYPDIYDLLKIADALITDYSSFIFEFSIAEPKPVFAYAKDRDSYDRGFYFDLDKLPYLFARTNKELVEGIMNYDQRVYEERLKQFYNDIDLEADGKASDRVMNYIIARIGENNVFETRRKRS